MPDADRQIDSEITDISRQLPLRDSKNEWTDNSVALQDGVDNMIMQSYF